jgi:hypothetical protein
MLEFFPSESRDGEADAKSLVGDLLRQDGCDIRDDRNVAKGKHAIIFERSGQIYVVEVKYCPEGRRDRVIPLVALAILQLRKHADSIPGHPNCVVMVVTNNISELVVEQVKYFAREHAPNMAVGVLDFQGFRSFAGHGFEKFNSESSRGRNVHLSSRSPISPQLFSDLNQWMLKVLLAPRIPESYLSAPRGYYQGASQLARASRVSTMSAFRFIKQFAKEGFLKQEPAGLRLVRKKELIERWLAANQRTAPEIAGRWLPHGGKDTLPNQLCSYVSADDKSPSKFPRASKAEFSTRQPRACLGLFAAADALGIGINRGVQPSLYMERAEPNALESLGLSANGLEQNADVYIRIPRIRESVFRGVVFNEGVPACDILQVWLDVANYPSRGEGHATLIWEKFLAPVLIDEDEQ